MGNSNSSSTAAADTNASINRTIQSDMKAFKDDIRILMLGAGESGKSTIIKQVKVLYGGGFSDPLYYKRIVISNVVENMQLILTGMAMSSDYDFLYPESVQHKKKVLDFKFFQPEDSFPEYLESVKCLWNDPNVRDYCDSEPKIYLPDNAS